MKIKPIILCGGAGTRLWPESKKNTPKQFIDFGGWTLFKKTLERIKNPIFDSPIISTNIKYLNLTKKFLLKYKIRKYTIVLEPLKKNTSAAILSSTLLKEIDFQQPIIFFPSDHLIEKTSKFIKEIKKNLKKLSGNNIFLFGIKPTSPSSKYGYLLTKKTSKNLNKVINFVEKPNFKKAKKILKKNGLWNSGMLLAKKISIINNFKNHDSNALKICLNSVIKSKIFKNIYHLDKDSFSRLRNISFDYAILEKSKNINAIKLDLSWNDLGSWKEITNIFKKNKKKYFKKKNVFYRPWGHYTNLFYGKGFLIKELVVNPKSSISLQKHRHRSEHWTVTSGKPKITINRNTFFKNPNESIFISRGAIHRIENLFKKPVKIMEVQIGSILKETDIIRYKDIYGRVN
tara:strand:+ start:4422 stop:5627 length:1206 start_codon:yes stop_codon:yes gene_type:complete